VILAAVGYKLRLVLAWFRILLGLTVGSMPSGRHALALKLAAAHAMHPGTAMCKKIISVPFQH
jgi:hypothetical protein